MFSQFEPYLQEVETRLRELPPPQRADEIEELRQHMQAMREARIEMGQTEAEAVAYTLAHFGAAQTVGSQLQRVLRRGDRSLPGGLWVAAGVALVVNQGQALMKSALSARLHDYQTLLPMPDNTAWWLTMIILTALLAGGLTGLIAPRRAIAGTLLAHITGTVVGGYVTVAQCGFPMLGDIALLVFLAECAIATPVALLAAGLAARWRKQQHRRARRSEIAS